jgi:L-seryl-tRNA(Ser) seleniumtransferase
MDGHYLKDGRSGMKQIKNKEELLRKLPGVDRILERIQEDRDYASTPKSVLVEAIRFVIEKTRTHILETGTSTDLDINLLLSGVRQKIAEIMKSNLRRTVNATGVVVHTNLGRSLLAKEAINQVTEIATAYSNLEFDILKGKRGLRYSNIENILCEISGAESGMVVNNNAAAVLLCLETMSKEKEVIVSRGELVEIGGSFRIPDVMAKSGGILKEVGTTNRTHPKDYEEAINDNTGLLLKVHTSNYTITGFTAEVSLTEMVQIGKHHNLPVMEDLGSGTFIDFSRYGLTKEPTVQESVNAGVDIVTFSGDKLLGGPQAGIIVGKKEIIEKIRKNPLTRALRIDKLTLAALESTLRLYRDPENAVKSIPTLRMITDSYEHISRKADQLFSLLEELQESRLILSRKKISSKTGGGALPLLDLPSMGVKIQIQDMTASSIEKAMRTNEPAIIGRIEEDVFIMDLRTVHDDEFSFIFDALKKILA